MRGDNCFRVIRDLSDCFLFPEKRYESFLTSGNEIQSLKSLITRKQLSPQREGAQDTYGLKNLNPFIRFQIEIFERYKSHEQGDWKGTEIMLKR